MPFSRLDGVGKLARKVTDFIVFLLKKCLVLKSERVNDPFMALLVVLCLPIELFFEAPDASQILLLLQKHTIALQVCILYPFLALISQLLNSLLFFFVESNTLLLILQ